MGPTKRRARSPTKRFSGIRERKPPRRLGGGESGEFLRRAACQVLPGRGLGNRAQAPEAHFDMFRDWQEITNSIFCGGPVGLRQRMDVWFWIAKEPPPRGHERELKT